MKCGFNQNAVIHIVELSLKVCHNTVTQQTMQKQWVENSNLGD